MLPRLSARATFVGTQIFAFAHLPTQMFPRLSTRATFVGTHKFCVRDTKHVSDSVQKHFVRPQQMFSVCAAWKHSIHFVSRAFALPRNITSNNVSATMCPRLPGPLASRFVGARSHFMHAVICRK